MGSTAAGQIEDPGVCTICASLVDEWAPGPGGRPKAACPHCGSLERHRAGILLLRPLIAQMPQGSLLLDVAPTSHVSSQLRAQASNYLSIDFDPSADRRSVDVQASLTRVPLRDGSVGLLICSHVLEHIPDDRSALAEVRRLLHPDGLAFIQVPRRRHAMTDEDPSASLEERKERFGQADHVRFYGDDFEERITGEGLHVETLTFHDVFDSDLLKAVGAATPEEVWLVSKSPDPTSVLTLEPAASALIRSTLQIEVEANSYQSDLQGLAQATLEMILLTRSNERLRQEIAELGSRYDWLAGRWPVRLGLRVKSSIRKAVDSVRNDKRR